MKKTAILSTLILFTSLSNHAQIIKSMGDNSPVVIANKVSINYGVRVDAVMAILNIYEKEGVSIDKRKAQLEALIKKYSETPEKKQGKTILTDNSKAQLGIIKNQSIVDALDWDLFARKKYLSLSSIGDNSPNIYAYGGEVNIWYGIPPNALRALAAQLEEHKTDLEDFEKKLMQQAKEYEDLKAIYKKYGAKDYTFVQAHKLLEEGKLKEAEYLIDSNYPASRKRQAYAGFIFGKTKELSMKYDSAAFGYRDAIFLDPQNIEFLVAYAKNEVTLAHYTEAMNYYEKTLILDSIINKSKTEETAIIYKNFAELFLHKRDYDRALQYYNNALEISLNKLGNTHANIASILNGLGVVWGHKSDINKAIEYFEKALQIDTLKTNIKQSDITAKFNNLGAAYLNKGNYEKAIYYFEQALKIATINSKSITPHISGIYSNLGIAWREKEDFEQAVHFFEKAAKIDSIIFGTKHPRISKNLHNFGMIYLLNADYDKALNYFEKALEIDSAFFGNKNQILAVRYNSLGMAWNYKKEFDVAINYFSKALSIDSITLDSLHPEIAVHLNNLGRSLYNKGKDEQAMRCFEKALSINSIKLGKQHPEMAVCYSNIALVWYKKKAFDTSIYYFKKALEINSNTFGIKHSQVAENLGILGLLYKEKKEPDTAIIFFQKELHVDSLLWGTTNSQVSKCYQNISLTWMDKKNLDSAIVYLKKSEAIDSIIYDRTNPELIATVTYMGILYKDKGIYIDAISYFEKAIANLNRTPNHDFFKIEIIKLLATTANEQGMKLFQEKKFEKALFFFQKGFQNAEISEDTELSIICLNNIGSMHKLLGNFKEGLEILQKGIARAEKLNQEIDKQLQEIPKDQLNRPDVKNKIANLQNIQLLHRMKYHTIVCLIGLGKKNEAKELFKKLKKEAIEAKDNRTIEDLEKISKEYLSF